MRRSRVLALAAAFALVGAIAPIGAMFYFSWQRAVENEQDRLALYAERALSRARLAYDEALATLREMDELDVVPCSPAHITRMRVLTINVPSVEEIGYFQDGFLKCTSWGAIETEIPLLPGDFVTRDGIDVTVRLDPMVTHANPKMALRYKSHNVLIEPIRFVDIVVDSTVQLALTTEGGVLLAARNDPNAEVVAVAAAQASGRGMSREEVFSSARDGGLVAVAMESRRHLSSAFQREQALFLPFGGFIAVFMIAIVVWLSRRRLSLRGELEIAIRKREFVVHYQPIVDLDTGRCIGAEALVRWQRPDGTMVRPDLFIPFAEESGLVLPITDQVVEAVAQEMAPALAADPDLHIAINICAHDIKTGRVLDVVAKAMARSGIRAEQIWLEATERGFMDADLARETIVKARELGHAVAIDDFGTGYSSLSYLQDFPLDALKIDKAFIDTIGTDAATSGVTPHIIDMAKTLHLKIIAEGVETEAQAAYLRSRHVEYGQGWLFAKPMPAADFVAYCLRNQRVPTGGAAQA